MLFILSNIEMTAGNKSRVLSDQNVTKSIQDFQSVCDDVTLLKLSCQLLNVSDFTSALRCRHFHLTDLCVCVCVCVCRDPDRCIVMSHTSAPCDGMTSLKRLKFIN